MRWYVSRRGEIVGPVEAAQVEQWIRSGMTDAHLRAEDSAEWVPVAKSPFAKVAPGRRVGLIAGVILVVLTPLMLVSMWVEAKKRAKEDAELAAAPQIVPAEPKPDPSADMLEERARSVQRDRTSAWIAAREAVTRSLKSPSTADFGGLLFGEQSSDQCGAKPWGVDYRPETSIWRCTGWVDAQNSFGATVRNDWVVSMRLNPATSEWTVTEGPTLTSR